MSLMLGEPEFTRVFWLENSEVVVHNSHKMFIHRALTDQLLKAARSFAAVIVTGPRRSGKTTLLRRVFPKASYHLLEDPDTVARLRADPRSFLEEDSRSTWWYPPAIAR